MATLCGMKGIINSTNQIFGTKGVVEQKVLNSFVSDLAKEKWGKGEAIPSERELSESYGVSRVTMRRALSRLSERGLLERIQGKGTYVKRIPYPEEIPPSPLQSRRILFLVPALKENPVIATTMHALSEAAHDSGYQVNLCSVGRTPDSEHRYLQSLDHSGIGGICIWPHFAMNNVLSYAALKHKKVPFVLINLPSRELLTDYVTFDHEQGGYLQANNLIKLGHQRVAMIKPPCLAGDRRFAGFMRAFSEANLSFYPSLIHEVSIDEGSKCTGFEVGCLASKEFLSKQSRATAVVVDSESEALGVLQTARTMGLRVPEDVSLIAYGNASHGENPFLNLSTIDLPFEEMGKAAFRVLLERIENPDADIQQTCLPVSFVRGETISPVG